MQLLLWKWICQHCFSFFPPEHQHPAEKGRKEKKTFKKTLIPRMAGGLSSSEHTGHSNTCNKRNKPEGVREHIQIRLVKGFSQFILYLFGFYSNNSVYTQTSMWKRILECKVIKPNPSGQSGYTPELPCVDGRKFQKVNHQDFCWF